jgi:transposase
METIPSMAQISDQGSVGTGATEGVPGTTGVAPVPACEARSDPELVERPKRRKFSAEYKLRILELADQCTEPGSLGRLLRKEGLYWSRLSDWRRQREEGTLHALSPARRGRKHVEPNPLLPEIERLRSENKRLVKRLEQAELLIEVQKKISRLLGLDESKGSN